MKYEIIGGSFPVVVCHLRRGEQMRAEAGSMVWMDPCMQMETSGGSLGRVIGRKIAGELAFQNVYNATADGKIAFGSSFPGKILPIEIQPGSSVVMQKQAFLASTIGVDMNVCFQENAGAGLFGGDGFVMQRFTGHGMAFVECDGDLVEYELAPGQQLVVDTGNVLGYQDTATIHIQRIRGVKNVLLGGEGLFNTVLTGPGKVWLQTYSMAGLVDLMLTSMKSSGKRGSESSVLESLLSA